MIDKQPLIDALQKIADAHKFNMTQMRPVEVHEVCYKAIAAAKPDPEKAREHATHEGISNIVERLASCVENIDIDSEFSKQLSGACHRFIEDALELVQACAMPKADAHALVEYVYGRPVGERTQEVGGVMTTLAALCNAHDMDMQACGETELARVSEPGMLQNIRLKYAAKPRGSALPIATQHAGVPEGRKQARFREDDPEGFGYTRGWNACREAMLAAASTPEVKP